MDKFDRIAADFLAGKAVKAPLPKYRDPATQGMFEGGVGSSGKGKHHNRDKDVAKGRSRKQKHKKNLRYERYGENQPLMMRHDYGSHTAEDIMSEEMYARVKSRKHHSKKDVEDSMKEHGLDKNPKWLEYEGRFDPSTGKMRPPKQPKNDGLSALDSLGKGNSKSKPKGKGGLDALSRLAHRRLASIRIEEAMGADGNIIRLHDQIEHKGDLAHVLKITYDPRTRQKMIKHKHISSGKEMTVPASQVTLAKGVSRRASQWLGGDVLSRLYDTGLQSSKGVYGEHTLDSLGLTSQMKRELQSLERSGYIVRFEGVWGPSVQLTEKGLKRLDRLMDEERSRIASDSYHGGSYMSYQNIGEMLDALDVLGNMIHRGDELDDWVEDKISHAHQLITDLARYFAYGEGYHTHDDEEY